MSPISRMESVLYIVHAKFVPPFMTLTFGDHYLHNCVVDSGAESNIMPLKLMRQLGLKISVPSDEICGFNASTPTC